MHSKYPGARLARFALVVMLAVVVMFAFSRLREPLNIDTDLKNMSPALSDDPALQGAVNTLSRSLESRLVILIKADKTAVSNAAAMELATMLNSTDGVQTTVGNSASAPLLDLFTQYRFNLLGDTQRMLLESHSTDDIVRAATARLYQLSDSGRVLPFERDPLGWFTDYLGEVAGKTRGGENSSGVTAIYVHLGDHALDDEFQKNFTAGLQQSEAVIAREFPSVQVLKSGIFLFAEQAASSARRDITLISTLSSIAVIGLILLAFRSLRPIVLALVSIAVGIGFAFVSSHLLVGSVHILTLVFGAGLIGIVIDYALHYSYHQTWDDDDDNHNGRSALLRAMALGLCSSVIGYGALSLSSLPALGRVALFSCLGLAASWICVIALGPYLGKGNAGHQSVVIETATNRVLWLAQHIAAKPKLLIGVILATLIGLAVTGVQVNDNSRALFNPDPALIAQERQVAELTGNLEPGQYFIVRGNTIDELYAAIARLEQQVPADRLLSIRNLLPSPISQRNNYALQRQLYQDNGAVSAFLVSLDADPAIGKKLFNEYLALDGQVIDPLQLAEVSGNALPPLVLRQDNLLFGFVLIRDRNGLEAAIALANHSPDITFIDTAGMTSRALGEQRHSALWILLVGYALIGGLLLLRYRKIAALGLLLVPAISMLAVLGVFSLLGISITLFHTMALFLVLGLGMDYVIFRVEMRSQLSITSQAVFLSALTSLLSFGLLAWSSMPVVQAFGLTLMIGNLFNLVGALVYAEVMLRNRWLQLNEAGAA